ncbi:MAG: hypothetical protein AMXMBFR82_29830 [Candidatus Hydrogenedentota bacterium]
MILLRKRSRLLKGTAVLFCLTLVMWLVIWIWFPSLPQYAMLSLLGALVGADTQYAPDFHPLEWDRIRVGDSEEALYTRFGKPLLESDPRTVYDWSYDELEMTITLDDSAPGGGKVISNSYDEMMNAGIDKRFWGMTGEELVGQLGEPTSIEKRPQTLGLWYSTPQGGLGGGHYVMFRIGVDTSTESVIWKYLDFYWD